ncbi:hypothetical protein [Streptomyces sp. NPDC053431]|uniref:hypothetical protein n=1 Tax=Streptomyces sp. NPDC053431 TaxID=3365703 RepID=UPI0037D50BF6
MTDTPTPPAPATVFHGIAELERPMLCREVYDLRGVRMAVNHGADGDATDPLLDAGLSALNEKH